MEDEIKILEFEGIQFVGFIESHSQAEHPGYHANNVLFHVEKGQLNIKKDHKLYTVQKGNFCLVKKYTEVSYFKTWSDREGYAIVKVMILKDDLIHQAIEELGFKIPKRQITEPVVNLKNNTILKGLYESLTLYLADNQIPSKHLLFLKTKEALLGILQSSPKNLALFHEFSKPVKANLREFMIHHVTTEHSLATIAKLSGRSLSTFNRDFRKAFQIPPHKWILKKRLEKAREILLTTSKKSSEIYLELGFKDLAHFSRTFKKEFQITPSEIKGKIIKP